MREWKQRALSHAPNGRHVISLSASGIPALLTRTFAIRFQCLAKEKTSLDRNTLPTRYFLTVFTSTQVMPLTVPVCTMDASRPQRVIKHASLLRIRVFRWFAIIQAALKAHLRFYKLYCLQLQDPKCQRRYSCQSTGLRERRVQCVL